MEKKIEHYLPLYLEQKEVLIYTLSCPETGMVRYIGITSRTMKKRFNEHLRDKTNGVHKNCWIKSLKTKGLIPVVNVIDVVKSNWEFWEQHYISLYKSWGFDLTNQSIGGRTCFGVKKSTELKKKLSEIQKQYCIDNPDSRKDFYKKVNQFDSNGAFIKQHVSLMEASKAVGVCASAISQAIKRSNLSGGYLWSFSEISPTRKSNRYKKIIHDQTGIEYNSITEAANLLGIDKSGVGKCVKKIWSHYKNQTFSYANQL